MRETAEGEIAKGEVRVDLERLEAEGVFEPDSERAAERLELLEYLDSAGATTDQIIEAAQLSGGLYSLAAVLRGPKPVISLEELAERTSQPVELIRASWTAFGLTPPEPGEPILSEEAAERLSAMSGLQLFAPDSTLSLVRAAGQALARFADAVMQAYIDEVEIPLRSQAVTELQNAQLAVMGNEVLLRTIDAVSTVLWHHLALAAQRNRRGRHDHDDPARLTMAIGFIDLVGFTSLSFEAEPLELRKLVQEFEAVAVASASSRGGFVVKFIGDAVMFGATGATAALMVAIEIIDNLIGSQPRLTSHGGLAMGTVLARGGDYFGPVVNLASRAEDQAAPDEVLLSDAFMEALDDEGASLPDGWTIEPAGRRVLKGFEKPARLWSLTRSEPDSSPEGVS